MGRAEDVTVAEYSPGMREAQDLTLIQMWQGEREGKNGKGERSYRQEEVLNPCAILHSTVLAIIKITVLSKPRGTTLSFLHEERTCTRHSEAGL